MRKLIVHRERALAGFGLSYHCILDRSCEELKAELADQETRMAYLTGQRGGKLSNGSTIACGLDESAHSLIILACLEQSEKFTEPLSIPAGAEDIYALVTTEFDGYHRPTLKLERVEGPEE